MILQLIIFYSVLQLPEMNVSMIIYKKYQDIMQALYIEKYNFYCNFILREHKRFPTALISVPHY